MYAQYLWISKRVSIRRVNRNKRISVYESLFGVSMLLVYWAYCIPILEY